MEGDEGASEMRMGKERKKIAFFRGNKIRPLMFRLPFSHHDDDDNITVLLLLAHHHQKDREFL